MLPYAFTTTSDNSATLYTQFSITLMTWVAIINDPQPRRSTESRCHKNNF